LPFFGRNCRFAAMQDGNSLGAPARGRQETVAGRGGWQPYRAPREILRRREKISIRTIVHPVAFSPGSNREIARADMAADISELP